MLVGNAYEREIVIMFLAKAANLVLAGININNEIKILNFI
ncbi:unnamed protein product [marine sediment metagenome]|uniref:Uncharacterized protein n=1 Tax=marine sediment metagenome TaxID=412755 RepID=X0XQM8_9ZZZZ